MKRKVLQFMRGVFAVCVLAHSIAVAAQESDSSGPAAAQRGQQKEPTGTSAYDSDEPPGKHEPVNGAYRVGGGVIAPVIIKSPQPGYTEAARKAKIAGVVVLWLVVNAKGLPEQIRVQKSLDPGLDQNAAKAVKHWRFKPAEKDGKPVAVAINIEVNFTLY